MRPDIDRPLNEPEGPQCTAESNIEPAPDCSAVRHDFFDHQIGVIRQPGIYMEEQQNIANRQPGSFVHLYCPAPFSLKEMVSQVPRWSLQYLLSTPFDHNDLMSRLAPALQLLQLIQQQIGLVESRNNNAYFQKVMFLFYCYRLSFVYFCELLNTALSSGSAELA